MPLSMRQLSEFSQLFVTHGVRTILLCVRHQNNACCSIPCHIFVIRKDLAKMHEEPPRSSFDNTRANTVATHSMVCVVNYIWRSAECHLPNRWEDALDQGCRNCSSHPPSQHTMLYPWKPTVLF